MKIIIYGTGGRASIALKELRESYSDEDIIGFTQSEYDESLRELYGKPVLNRNTINNIYGGVKYYLSPANPVRYEIQEELIRTGFASVEQILNYEEKYVSCKELEESIIISNTGLVSCCHEPGKNPSPHVVWQNDIEDTVDQFIKNRDSLIKDLKQGKHNQCSGCKSLHEGYWERDKKIRTMQIGLCFPCQCSCCYCTWPCNAKYISNHGKKSIDLANNIDVPAIIDCLTKKSVFPKNGFISIASGEISVAQNREAILEACVNHPIGILSNGIIYSEKIAEIVAENKESYINVSIDAGTRDTYLKVKGIDAFNKVVENLMKYKNRGDRVILKYILLDENNNEKDIMGFLKLVERVRPGFVMISFDFANQQNNIPVEILDGAAFLYGALEKKGIKTAPVQAFGADNLSYIINRALKCDSIKGEVI